MVPGMVHHAKTGMLKKITAKMEETLLGKNGVPLITLGAMLTQCVMTPIQLSTSMVLRMRTCLIGESVTMM